MATELRLNAHIAQIAIQSLGRLLATFAIFQGLNIIIGGLSRWTDDSFEVALMLPGAPPSWGVILLVMGALALGGSLVGKLLPVMIGMFGCSVWSAFFALSFGLTAARNPESSTTAIWTYATFAVLFVHVGVVYKESRKSGDCGAIRSDHT